jgi:hypothetical protein
VPREKISAYLLDESRRGTRTYKAGLFRGVLGFSNEALLTDRLRDHVASRPPVARERSDVHSHDKYAVQGSFVGQNGREVDLITVWRVADDGGVPVFVTAVPAPRGGATIPS